MGVSIIAPLNFKHKAGDGVATRNHRITDIAPALQSACGETQCSYVLEEENMDNEEIMGSIYVGKSEQFQRGMLVNRDISKTLMTGGECAIIIGNVGSGPSHQRRNVYDSEGIAPTLMASMGMGGGIIPFIAENKEMDTPVRLGNVYDEKFGQSFGGGVWDTDGVAPTLKTTAAASQQHVIVEEPKIIECNDAPKHQQDLVQSADGICRTIAAGTHGSAPHLLKTLVEEPQIVASRGRGEENDQQLEVQKDGVANTLTSAQKDNMVLEPTVVGGLGEMNSNGGTQYFQHDRVYDSNGVSPAHQAQLAGGSYKYMVEENKKYRIRKLTPRECFRLMGVKDEDSDKVTVSNSQKYKQAGNSIVVDVLMAIFENMFVKECKKSSLF